MNLKIFEQNLMRAVAIAQLSAVLRTYLADIKISTFSFTYYAYHSQSKAKIKYDFASENLKMWHRHYLEENFDTVDSILNHEQREILPIYWAIEQQLKEAKNKREKKMRLFAQKFGTEKGLSIPVHGYGGDFANLMVEQLKGETCLENWQELKYELQVVAYYYLNYLRKLLIKEQPAEINKKFSKREMQCLNLLAQNYSIKEIAKTMFVAERTINYHIQNTNKKLGTKNKYQSVAKVLEMGLLVL